jgi:hypothetical protein
MIKSMCTSVLWNVLSILHRTCTLTYITGYRISIALALHASWWQCTYSAADAHEFCLHLHRPACEFMTWVCCDHPADRHLHERRCRPEQVA